MAHNPAEFRSDLMEEVPFEIPGATEAQRKDSNQSSNVRKFSWHGSGWNRRATNKKQVGQLSIITNTS